MLNYNQMFLWLNCVLEHLKLPSTNLNSGCLDENKGRFIHAFGLSFLGSLLYLTDQELAECHPETKSPLSLKERQELQRDLIAHILICPTCVDSELREEARKLIAERVIRKKLSPTKEILLNP